MNRITTETSKPEDPEDQEERDQVLCPRKSFLVRAPAGSGKTTLLADRYRKLLEMLMADNEKRGPENQRGPENILCLTFTRKAAGEMRDRIQCRIQKSEIVKDKGIGNRINVQTIDSFQRALARTDSLRSHIMPHFRTTGKRDYFHRAVDESHGQGEKKGGALIDEKMSHFDKRPIRNKTVQMLLKRDQWAAYADKVRKLEKRDENQSVLAALGEISDDLDRIHSKERDYDYIAVSRAATRLVECLGKPPCLESVLGDPVLHILVDEFQDVSAAQHEFFEAMVLGWENDETRSFFAVGDTMQSIYRFRGAGTDVILDMFNKDDGTAKLGELKLRVVELKSNFRSAKSIVNGVYKLLERGSGPGRKKGEARLLKPTAEKKDEGEFGVKWFEKEEDEATWVAGEMEKWIENSNGQCEGNDQNRELAVLVRARSHFTELIQPKLNRENLNCIDVNFAPLDRVACVNDICTLARCIEDPEDEAASLALLRSPLLAMKSSDLHSLYTEGVPGGDGEERMTPLRELVDEYRKGPSGYLARLESRKFDSDTIDAIGNFATTYWRARAEMTRMPVRSWLERAWFRVGGGAIYCGDADKKNLEQFLDLLEEVNGGSRRCDWRELDRLLKLLRGVSRCPQGKVKVMTIHGSKGLEFSEVIVPFLHKPGQYSPRDLVMIDKEKETSSSETVPVHMDRNEEVEVEKNKDKEKDKDKESKKTKWVELRRQENDKNQEELRRLLYVAATRAKDSCWLTLTKPEKEKKKSQVKEFENLSMIKQVVDGHDLKKKQAKRDWEFLEDMLKCRKIGFEQGKSACGEHEAAEAGPARSGSCSEETNGVCSRVTKFKTLQEYVKRTSALCSDREFGRISTKSQERAVDAVRNKKEVGKEKVKRAVGVVVHEEIERVLMCSEWPGEDLSKYTGAMWDSQCRKDLMRAGAEANDVHEDAKKVRWHLENVCNDACYMRKLWSLNNGEDLGWSLDFEQSFFGLEEVTKRPDLLVLNENDKKCLVIDFKTGARNEEYREQVKEYMDLLEKSLPGFVVEGALYYTSTSELVSAGQEFGNVVGEIFQDR